MKRWAWLVAALYMAVLLILTIPTVMLAFAPEARFLEAARAYALWPYWSGLAIMLLSQALLLSVPVRMASRRPVAQGPVWRTIAAGGLMAGGLVAGATFSLFEFFKQNKSMENNDAMLTIIEIGLIAWALWALIFARISRRVEPSGLVSKQCRWLLKGSILELLVAVPTHIVARYRDYCCAGFLTFIGLTMGISVMLFAFGPSVFFLFAERWKRLHPEAGTHK